METKCRDLFSMSKRAAESMQEAKREASESKGLVELLKAATATPSRKSWPNDEVTACCSFIH